MKNTHQIIAMLSVITLLTSCQKFIDIKPNSTITLIQTSNDCQLLLNDYADLNTKFPSDGEASSDDYYLEQSGYEYYSVTAEDRTIYNWLPGALRAKAAPQWQSTYYTVYIANLVLDKLPTLTDKPSASVKNNIQGQALFFRAYSFWEVAQLYAKPYTITTANSDPGIPLRLSSDINGKSTRGTVAQTYAQIISDLQQAVTLLPDTLVVASRPNKAAAYAMLARVYLCMGDYANAETNAGLSLKLNNQLIDYNTLDTTSQNPFERFDKEDIFHAIMTPGNTLNPGGGSGSGAIVDSNLYASYSDNDLRKFVFFKPNPGTDAGYYFTGNYEPQSGAELFDGLAVDEMYLTRAECYARAGDVTNAMADLNTLLITRWKTGTYVAMTASTADNALTLILTERRKELVMRGTRWTDLRRLNMDSRFAITLTRNIEGATYTLPPNDLRYTLLIPQEVITNAGIAQNPR